MQRCCMVGVAVYLTLVEPQGTKQGQPSRAEKRQEHHAGECGQELGGSVPVASPARQTSPEGRWPSRLCSGGCLSSESAQTPPHRSTARIQSGDLGTSQTYSRDPGEIQNSEVINVERGHLQSEGTGTGRGRKMLRSSAGGAGVTFSGPRPATSHPFPCGLSLTRRPPNRTATPARRRAKK
ncbi:hypothetical protein HJG60_010083 [Phyllostomus discolor]|uniref:Uncharacterized protein n=1 Tax=Phyllostomus discolor TaxID=89673 RepID=A0A834EJZ0_9CHIR|nr:hypothetical protein HJG60_010083 [Phyllostomus discolor]